MIGLPASKYKKKYAEDLVEYFERFIEMRDDPNVDDAAERHGNGACQRGLWHRKGALSDPVDGQAH